jgi:hypothetical protein
MATGGRLARGLGRKGGRTTVNFQFAANWKQVTRKAIGPSGTEYANKVHQAMGRGMSRASGVWSGGGVEDMGDEGWRAGIGTSGAAKTHWHLIEFGGGHHYPKAPVRRELKRFGKFKESGR